MVDVGAMYVTVGSANPGNVSEWARNIDSFPGIDWVWAEFSTAVVPEPSSVTLALMGAVGLLGYGWRRKRKRANAVS